MKLRSEVKIFNRRLGGLISELGELEFERLAVTPRLGHWVATPPGQSVTPHAHPHLEATFILVGGMDYRCGRREIAVRAGELFIMPPNVRHRWTALRQPQLHLSFILSFAPAGGGSPRECHPFLRRVGENLGYRLIPTAELRPAAELLINLVDAGGRLLPQTGRFALSTYLGLLCQELLQAGGDEIDLATQPEFPPELDEAERICRRVEGMSSSLMAREISLRTIAGHLGISIRHLCRVFRQRRQLTVWETMQRLRLAQAEKLLQESEYTVKEIGALCGMPNPSYFCRFFRQRTGRTPARFRELNRPGG